ncbi:MAG: methyltransferase domain-containing protein [Pirellulales bacterium]|nr:methyltransferase domain-containing protein [Pirellulales bacterium]
MMNPPSPPHQEIDRTCTFCGAEQPNGIFAVAHSRSKVYQFQRCPSCHAVYLWPKPTAEELAQAYDEAYYGEGATKFPPIIERAINRFRRGRARRVQRLVRPPARVLDVGCGNGGFLGHLIDWGYESYGIELPGKAADRASQIADLHLQVRALSEDDFSPAFFDAACIWHVFEHLPDPQRTLRILEKIVRPSGYVLMSLPNIDSLQSRLFRGNWFHLDPPRHLVFLGVADLTAAMDRHGFRRLSVRHFQLEQNVIGFQQSLMNWLTPERDALFEFLKGNPRYIERCSPWNVAFQKLYWITTFPLFGILAAAEAAMRCGGTVELIFQKKE